MLGTFYFDVSAAALVARPSKTKSSFDFFEEHKKRANMRSDSSYAS